MWYTFFILQLDHIDDYVQAMLIISVHIRWTDYIYTEQKHAQLGF